MESSDYLSVGSRDQTWFAHTARTPLLVNSTVSNVGPLFSQRIEVYLLSRNSHDGDMLVRPTWIT